MPGGLAGVTDAPTPRVSVVIPTYDRPAKLRECLAGLSRLDTDKLSFEVIVVDDGAPQSPWPVVSEFVGQLQVRLVTQQRAGPGSARNAGASAARGEYLAFIDDDCTPATDWLAVVTKELRRDDRRLLGGLVENALPQNPYSEATEQINRFVYEYNRSARAHEPFFTTNNIALSTALFRELGGFTTTIPSGTAEDKEFCDRWRANGLPLAHVPEAIVYHANDLTFVRFVRQHFNYGRGILAFRLMRRTRIPTAIVPGPWKFYAGLVLAPASQRAARRRWRVVALLAISQLATLAGALAESLHWRRLARAGTTQRTET